MKIRTLITSPLLAAGLLLGMTAAVQAGSGHGPGMLHDDAIHNVGYRYGSHGYDGDRHHSRRHCGHHCKRHMKKHGHGYRGHGHNKKHWRHYGYDDGHKGDFRKGHRDGYRDDGHRHDDDWDSYRRHRT